MVPDKDRLVGLSHDQPNSVAQEREPTLTVVLVNYESWPDIERLAAALRQEPEFETGQLHVIVVDNASAEPAPAHLLQNTSPGFRLVLRPENGGFAVGVNAGWRLARSPWLLVLNPDVEFERGMIGQVIGQIALWSENPDGPPGIVGFGLRNPDGSTQGSVGVFPSLYRTIREQFIPRSRRKYQADWRIRPGEVDWVTGACMLLNARMMDELHGMDEDFFLYHEEVALCRVARDRGWRVEFDPTIQVVHRHPLQDRAISPKMRVIIRHSKLLYFRKHRSGWEFLTLSRIVSLEALVRGAVARVRGLEPERRAWAVVADLSRRLRAGDEIRGSEVLRLANQMLDGNDSRSRRPPGTARGSDQGEHADSGGQGQTVPPRPAEERPG